MRELNQKEKLLLESQEKLDLLLQMINAMPLRQRISSVETAERDKNFRDVLMHLYEWHAMLERWYREGMDGDNPSMPAPGYKWKTLKELNAHIWQSYQDVTLNQAVKKVQLSHQRVLALIAAHTEEEIITKKYYKWTKTSNLYSYFAANTSNHYDWAINHCEQIAQKIMHSEAAPIQK